MPKPSLHCHEISSQTRYAEICTLQLSKRQPYRHCPLAVPAGMWLPLHPRVQKCFVLLLWQIPEKKVLMNAIAADAILIAAI